MAKDFTDGRPQEMLKTAGHLTAPDYGDDLIRHPAGACEGGMPDCAGLFGADLTSTGRVQELITHVRQGFTGFQSMVSECAGYYANAAGMSVAELDSVVNRPPPAGLPDREPRFQDPQGDTP